MISSYGKICNLMILQEKKYARVSCGCPDKFSAGRNDISCSLKSGNYGKLLADIYELETIKKIIPELMSGKSRCEIFLK